MSQHIRPWHAGLVGLSLLAVAPIALGQEPAEVSPGPTTLSAVAGEEYGAGGFHRFMLGSDYRDLWTTPIEAEVLDLESFAGGLTPVMRVGGQQSKGLALKGADGRDYTFRGIDKDPSGILPADLRETVVDELVQDQIAASHPAGALVAEALAHAAGVRTVDSRIVVLGDDPALGEFREAFAGTMGTISVYPQPVSDTNPGFEGATEILDHLELYAALRRSPEERIDVEAFLRARLFDVFIGDWDRHRKQWRWAKFPGSDLWQPIPEDRDQAFSRYEGLLMTLARPRQPRFVVFGPDYPKMLGLTWNGWEQDRVLLTGLEWPAWERMALDLQGRMTDDVIERAARKMPPMYFALDGERMIQALRKRRDALPDAARDYYELLAGKVDVHATDQPEVAEIRRSRDGTLDVTITPAGPDGEPEGEPLYQRHFLPNETDEVRVFLHGGDDRAAVQGPRGGMGLRVIGGEGADVLDDSLTGGTRFYDSSEETDVRKGPDTSLDTRPYEAPVPVAHVPWLPPRDWGHQILGVPYSGWSADYGLFLGTGVDWRRYGFRKFPYASRHVLRGGYAFRAKSARFDYRGEFRRENSEAYASLHAFASGLEILRFYGLGNETSDDLSDDFYKVRQRQYLFAPAYTFPLVGALELSVAPVVKYASTRDEEGTLIGRRDPYGVGPFAQAGGAIRLDLDTRDNGVAATRGVHLRATGAVYPSWWDVEETFGQLYGDVSGYLTAPGRFETTLAVRAGGQKNWGQYPFHEAAFIGGGGFFGGSQTVRGLPQNRYAGDAAVYGNLEVRTRLGRATLILPADIGVLALADVGRVFLDGEESNKWHPGWGGGIWLAYLSRSNTVSIAVAESEKRVALYVRLGFAF
ncbi:MAG: BamA/TamA family outer membrane protein [Acidobacteria bacterium]|nr:BamA/TamA family outer membrane protein [Acidobacteriota bacterium]